MYCTSGALWVAKMYKRHKTINKKPNENEV